MSKNLGLKGHCCVLDRTLLGPCRSPVKKSPTNWKGPQPIVIGIEWRATNWQHLTIHVSQLVVDRLLFPPE